jgi:hypothetical protein
MSELIEKLTPIIDASITKLQAKRFTPDPIAGEHYSRVTSVLSSAYKRHGFIIERAILERLKMCPDFEVWDDPNFQVADTADHMVDSALTNLAKLVGAEMSYQLGNRALQVDAIVFNKKTRIVRAYEIKRGSGLHDSGKRRSIMRDLLCVQILLKSYAKSFGFDPDGAQSHIIFYYGKCSIPKPYSVTRDEMDAHFGWPLKDEVEAINDLFRAKLHEILEVP